MTHPRAGTPVEEAGTFAAQEALFLSDLAAGKYDEQVNKLRTLLRTYSAAIPMLGRAEMILNLLLKLNKLTAPSVPVVADGGGGFVPESNSRFDPKTGRFL